MIAKTVVRFYSCLGIGCNESRRRSRPARVRTSKVLSIPNPIFGETNTIVASGQISYKPLQYPDIGPILEDSEPDRSTNMDRYTVYETKRTTATSDRSVWGELATPVGAFALHGGRSANSHTPSSLADSLPSVSCCAGFDVASHPRSGASTRSDRAPARRSPATAGYSRFSNDAYTSSRSLLSGRRAYACGYSLSGGEPDLSDTGGKAGETHQINSSRRHQAQGESRRFPALFSTTRSEFQS